jgi:diaminopimelate epimerase
MISGVRFEKWQALGNDYVIVDRVRVTPDTVRHLCDRHTGIGADGVLELSPPDAPGHVARLRIFNPDGSEAELSGNGARQAILYLRHRGWTEADTFSIQTVAGDIRPTITGPTTCRVDMGRASLTSKDYPGGPPDGTGTVEGHAFRHVSIGNPQCAIRIDDRDALERLDVQAVGPKIEHAPLFPNRTNASFWTELGPGTIRARIFERGAGETLSSGTGACGAAVAYVLGGGDSRCTVQLDGGELEVDVDESLHIHLSGWAVPVFKGELLDSVEER